MKLAFLAISLRLEMLKFLLEEANTRHRPLLQRDAEDPQSYEERLVGINLYAKYYGKKLIIQNFSAFLLAVFLDPRVLPYAPVTFQEFQTEFDLQASIYPRLLRMAQKFAVCFQKYFHFLSKATFCSFPTYAKRMNLPLAHRNR